MSANGSIRVTLLSMGGTSTTCTSRAFCVIEVPPMPTFHIVRNTPTYCELIIDVSQYTKMYGPTLGFAYRPEQDAFEPAVLNEPCLILTRPEFEELVEYCKRYYATHSDETIEAYNRRIYDDWATKEQTRQSLNSTPTPKPKRASGFLYLVKSDRGYYKIGKTKNPDDRQRTFGVQLPFEVEFVHVIESDAYHWAEEQLHARFSGQRIKGEWFDLTEEDVAWIKSLKRLDYDEA